MRARRDAGAGSPPGRARSREQPQHAGQVFGLVGARHDRIEVSEAEILLGQAEILGKLLACRLLNDPRPGERDQRARLGDRHIAQRRERRQDARRRRMRHHRDHRNACVVEILDCADRLRQLHQRQDPLLHPRAAGRGDRDQRHVSLGRGVAGSRELLADRAAHRASHEGEVHHGQLDRMPRQRGLADDHRLAQPGVQLRLGQALRVGTEVEELERVVGANLCGLFRERALVRVPRDTCPSPHRIVVAALGADPQSSRKLVVAEVRPAGRAGVRVLPFGGRGCVLVLDVNVDPVVGHRRSLDRSRAHSVTSPERGRAGRRDRHCVRDLF